MRPIYYRHIPPVGLAVSGMERVGCGGHIMPSDQRQWTLQKSRHYLVIVAETIRGKVDTAETGVGGDV